MKINSLYECACINKTWTQNNVTCIECSALKMDSLTNGQGVHSDECTICKGNGYYYVLRGR